VQGDLFDPSQGWEKDERLLETIDSITKRFGKDVLRLGYAAKGGADAGLPEVPRGDAGTGTRQGWCRGGATPHAWGSRVGGEPLEEPGFRPFARGLEIPLWPQGPVSPGELPTLPLYYLQIGFLASAYINQIGHGPANIALGNLETVGNFVPLYDEHWFILVHVEIEAITASVLRAIEDTRRALVRDDRAAMAASLRRIEDALRRQIRTLQRIRQRMAPVFITGPSGAISASSRMSPTRVSIEPRRASAARPGPRAVSCPCWPPSSRSPIGPPP
jgi:hypothetical protein